MPCRESEGTFELAHYRREADDLRAVIEHFSSTNRVIPGIIRHSKGGWSVLMYASKYDVCTVVNVSGRYDLKRGIVKHLGEDIMQKLGENGYKDLKDENGGASYRVTKECVMDLPNTNMHATCLHIDKDCKVLTVQGSEDELTPVKEAYEFAKIIPNHKLRIVEGAGHGYITHQAELASIVLEFIKASLEQDKPASS
ncbi:uncharacterized protein LOC133795397 [Humulus lupulus]|uniref:uncharacterized protein LOC133795397 n=1 Tax=Humulus lupulus TaxID=3486 RepID=UPI002B4045FD|nr:uncharacterized protein LOC133795397 [Humulus lupulus]